MTTDRHPLSPEQINKLASAISAWIVGNHPDITFSQDAPVYIRIFLEITRQNKGEPVHIDAFREDLWESVHNHVQRDDSIVTSKLEVFSDIWSAWVNLVRFLNQNNKGVLKLL